MRSTRFLHLVARGGEAAGHPENTLPAFQAALDLGVRFVEVDVQLSANGVPVAVRGDDVMVEGVLFSVGELTAAELAQVDASESHRFGQKFSGTCIPRLVDVLSLITKRAETTVFVNLCRASLGRFGHDQVVAQVAEAIRPFRSRCIVVSSDLPAVHRSRGLTGLQIGWQIQAYDHHTRLKYEALQPDYLFCDVAVLPPSGALWRGPWRWAVRAAATLNDALELASRGADFISTRDPRALAEAMKIHAAAQARLHDGTAGHEASTVVVRETLPRGEASTVVAADTLARGETSTVVAADTLGRGEASTVVAPDTLARGDASTVVAPDSLAGEASTVVTPGSLSTR